MIEGSYEWRNLAISRQADKGNCRSASQTISLRNAGFKVEMVAVYEKYSCGLKKRVLPFAPIWAVKLAQKMRRLKVDHKMKRKILEEARELGRPGPLAEALFVAAKMMD